MGVVEVVVIGVEVMEEVRILVGDGLHRALPRHQDTLLMEALEHLERTMRQDDLVWGHLHTDRQTDS